MLPSLAFVALLSAAPHTSQPWYVRPTCKAAVDTVMAVRLQDAEKRISRLEKGDVEDRACAAWARVTMAETQIAAGGRMPALMKNRERRLLQLFKFAKRHRNHQHLADLAIEARIRRVRVLLDKGERTKALEESQLAEKLLERRGKASNPTLDYTRGVTNMAVSQSGWALKTLLSVAGVSGDASRGREALEALATSGTVYEADAQYVRHFFAVQSKSEENGDPAALMKTLVDRYPSNPQLVYEYAMDLWRAKKCDVAFEAVSPTIQRIDADPGQFSNMVRAKLYWIGGACAADIGKRDLARRYAKMAEQQKFEPLAERIQELSSAL